MRDVCASIKASRRRKRLKRSRIHWPHRENAQRFNCSMEMLEGQRGTKIVARLLDCNVDYLCWGVKGRGNRNAKLVTVCFNHGGCIIGHWHVIILMLAIFAIYLIYYYP